MSDVEIKAKRPKMTIAEATTAKEGAPPPGTCAHWVSRKKRFCKMTLAEKSTYCGEHKPSIESEQAKQEDRIICPLDGKHTVYKSKLEKHLRICNARRKEDEPAYIEKDVNAGPKEDAVEDCSKLKLSELEDGEFYGVIEKVRKLHSEYIEGQIETLTEQHASLDTELANPDYGKEARKHLLQASALLGILQSEKQLLRDTSFIEFGAGKGQLAFYLALELQQQRLENSQVVLIDRMSLRHKKDNKIEDKTLVHRIRADIADFCIERLELLQQTRRNVAVSKHLCGAATDLTLRCITRQPAKAADETSAKDNSNAATEFVMIALCCHHRCEWRSFVGKDFFVAQSLTPREFAIITKMVSWAICGSGLSRERRRALEEQALSQTEINDINSAKRLSLAERELIGFMCKRVLDHARLVFLREQGYEAALKYYVPHEVTLENVCLLAKKQK